MLFWLKNNAATIIIAAVLAAFLILITVRRIRDKKRGIYSCGCGCESCALKGSCNNKNP